MSILTFKKAHRIKRFFLLFLALTLAVHLFACAAEPSQGEDMAAQLKAQAAETFTDVSQNAWYAESVGYCIQEGLMSGVTGTTFAPNEPASRAMLVTVLYRRAGSPTVTDAANFSDVSSNSWYATAVAWAAGEGIVSGYSDGRFGGNDPVTREQFVTILYRNEGQPEPQETDAFADQNKISSYAANAVKWAKGEGIVSGREGNRFDPKANMTRGEMAAVLHRWLSTPEEDPIPTPEPTPELTPGSGSSGSFGGNASGSGAVVPAPTPTLVPTPTPIPTPDMEEVTALEIVIGSKIFTATLADTQAAREFAQLLPMTITMNDYSGFEKVGSLGTSLTASNSQITTTAGDIVLYNSSNIVMFYGSNSWSYTRLGRINDLTGWTNALGSGSVEVTFRLAGDQQEPPQDEATAAAAPVFDFETKTVTLNSGYTMPINGLGTYSLTGETCVNSVRAALESGVRLIDTAHMYGNETEVGQAIRESMEELGIQREEIFVITKIYPGSDMADPEAAIQACLDRLDIGYVDMMLLHHPDPNDVKAYKAMEAFVKAGKIRSIGLSNWYVEELESFLPQVDTVPALVQNEIHPYYQENDVIPYIQNLGIVVQGWYPLGGRGHTAELLGNETISAIAAAHNVSSAQVILRWNLQKGVVVIPGSSNPDHIRENTELYDFTLTEAEMSQINALDRGEKHDWY